MARSATDYPDSRTQLIPVRLALDLWLADRRSAGRSPRTVADYASTGRQLLWWLDREGLPQDLAELTADVLRRFLSYCREGNPEGRWGCRRPPSRRPASVSAVHKAYRNLRAFLRFCVQDDLLPRSPMTRLTAPKLDTNQREPLTGEEVTRLLLGARRSGLPDRDAALVLLLLDTGLRASEACGLTIGHALSAEFSAEVVGKCQKRRAVFWSPETAKALRRHLRARGCIDPAAPLFVTRTGRPFTAANVHEVVSDAGERGAVGRPVFPHLLRHTAALALLRGGANVLEVQRILGHSDLSVLRRYVLESREDLQRAHAAASPVRALAGGGRR